MSDRFIDMRRPGFLGRPVQMLSESVYEVIGEELLSELANRYSHRQGFNLREVQSKLKTLVAHIIADGLSKTGKSGTPYRDARAILWRYLSDKFPEEVPSYNLYPFAKHVNQVVGKLDTEGKLTEDIYSGFGPWLEDNFPEAASHIATRITGAEITPEYVRQALGDTDRGSEKLADEPRKEDAVIAPEDRMTSSPGGPQAAKKILTAKIANGQSIEDYIGRGVVNMAVWEPARGELEFSVDIPKFSDKAVEVNNLNPDQVIELGNTLASLLKKAGLITGGEVLFYQSSEEADGAVRVDFDLQVPPTEDEEHRMAKEDPRELYPQDHEYDDVDPDMWDDGEDDEEDYDIISAYGMGLTDNKKCACASAEEGCTCDGCDDCRANKHKAEEECKMSPQRVNEEMRVNYIKRRQNMMSNDERYGRRV